MNSESCIIAEAGTCHADDDPDARIGKAIKYAHHASFTGADVIKFQIFDNPNSDTMFCWIDGDEERSKRWKQSRLDLDQWKIVKQACDDLGIIFIASVFEYETVKWLSELNVEATKVASRAAGNIEVFKDAPRPLFVSNGMHEVPPGDDRIVFQCEANYPSTSIWDGESYGFSDHSGNPDTAIDALTRGCVMVEVHFYVNQEDAGPDLPASLSLEELRLVCDARDSINEM